MSQWEQIKNVAEEGTASEKFHCFCALERMKFKWEILCYWKMKNCQQQTSLLNFATKLFKSRSTKHRLSLNCFTVERLHRRRLKKLRFLLSEASTKHRRSVRSSEEQTSNQAIASNRIPSQVFSSELNFLARDFFALITDWKANFRRRKIVSHFLPFDNRNDDVRFYLHQSKINFSSWLEMEIRSQLI